MLKAVSVARVVMTEDIDGNKELDGVSMVNDTDKGCEENGVTEG
jgi:hypothetical protein